MRLRVEVSGGVVVFSGCGGGLGPQLACWQWLPLGARWLAGWNGLGWAGRDGRKGVALAAAEAAAEALKLRLRLRCALRWAGIAGSGGGEGQSAEGRGQRAGSA